MALTPQNNEAFLREVDEELRRDQLVSVWQRYGRWIVVGVVAALALLGGVLFWQHRERVAQDREGEQLQAAYDKLGAQDEAGSAKALNAIAASDNEGYRALAIFSQADVLLQKDDLKGAAAKFAAVANDGRYAEPFRDVALIRQTTAEFDTLKPEVVVQRLGRLTEPGSTWLGSAGELVAIAYLQQGKKAEAAQLFGRIAKDQTVPRSIRQRAVQMAGVMGVDVADALAPPPSAATKDVTTK